VSNAVGSFHIGTEAIKVDIGRSSRKTVAISVPLFVLLSALSVLAARDGQDVGTTAIGYAFATFFALPALIALLNLKKILRSRGLAFDARGVHYWEGDSWAHFHWNEVAGVGIGFEEPPRVPTIRPGKMLANALLDAAEVERRRHISIEVFPKDPQAIERQMILLRYRRALEPPSAHLPSVRCRFPLPSASLTPLVSQGVERFQPGLWLGWFARPAGSWRQGRGGPHTAPTRPHPAQPARGPAAR